MFASSIGRSGRMAVRTLGVTTALALVLFALGCSSSNSMPPVAMTPTGTAMTVSVGDAPVDGIVDFEITINQITLTDASNNTITVLNTPTRVELSHVNGTVEPIAVMNVPAGTYTKATITVSNPEVEIVNSTGQVQELTSTLASTTATVTFSPNLVVTSGMPILLNFDFNLAASVSISGTTATITPTFTATTSQVKANENEQDDDNGESEDVKGTVTGVAAPNFTISVEQSSQSLTFTTNSSTQFEGVSGVSGLTNGMIVEVDSVTQSDGSHLATKVEVEENDAEGLEAEGLITSTTGTPVTQFQIVVQDEAAPGSTMPALGSTLTVNLTGNTVFRIGGGHHIILTGLSITPLFDASHLADAQRVEVDSTTASTSTVTADKVRLQPEGISGVVSNVVQIDSSHISFTLTPAADSFFDKLSGQTSLTVLTQPNTEMKVMPTANATVRVRGLLFVNGTAYTMVAAKVMTPQ
jgi:uncharacterized protein DUF5666/uncharacterized protein DUF4382